MLRPALVLLILLSALTGLAYPLAITGLAQLAFPTQANGSLLLRDGRSVGALRIGQDFAKPGYFHGRPSATKPPYDAAGSGAANLGPTSQKLIDRIRGDAAGWPRPIPADAVTTSASGLDPHISPATAFAQVARVARARGWTEARVAELVGASVETPWLGVIGEPRVNVLRLNLALDAAAGGIAGK